MAYEDDRAQSLHMPFYFGGHLLNIPIYLQMIAGQKKIENLCQLSEKPYLCKPIII